MAEKIRLSPETRRQIQAQHADAVQRLLQAEALTEATLTEAVEDATRRLVDAVVAAAPTDEERGSRVARQAIREQTARLQETFAAAVVESRKETRKLSDGQVALEMGLLAAALAGQELDEPNPDPAVRVDDSSDSSWAVIAAGSMAAAWGAAALSSLNRWRREGAKPAELPRTLRRAAATVTPRIRRHAVTQAADVYNEHHQAKWQAAVKQRPEPSLVPHRPPVVSPAPPQLPRDLGPYRTAPAEARRGEFPGPVVDTEGLDVEDIETEQGLPYGWQSVVYDVWSAVLDRKTCPICFKVDGSMVPPGREFPDTVAGRPPEHPHCRCVIVSCIIPEALRKRLPGMQIDYAELKDDIREYFQGASLKSLSEGKRHALGYIQDTIGGRSFSGRPGTSPEALTRRLQNRRGYRVNPRAGRRRSFVDYTHKTTAR
jgi:hypothetical protein